MKLAGSIAALCLAAYGRSGEAQGMFSGFDLTGLPVDDAEEITSMMMALEMGDTGIMDTLLDDEDDDPKKGNKEVKDSKETAKKDGEKDAKKDAKKDDKPKKMKLKDMTATMGKLVNKLSVKVKKAHDDDAKSQKNILEGFDACRGPDRKTTDGVSGSEVSRLQTDYDDKLKLVNGCPAELKKKKEPHTECKTTVDALKATQKADCDNFDQINQKKDEAAKECTALQDELDVNYVARMKKFIDEELAKSNKAEGKCTSAKGNVTGPEADCEKKKKEYTKVETACKTTYPSELSAAKCSWRTARKNMCTTYDRCYQGKLTQHKDWVNGSHSRVAQRKLEFRLITRLQCLVGSMDNKTGKVDTKKLDECAKVKRVNTDKFNLTISDAPAKVSCDKTLGDIDTKDCDPTTTTTTTTTSANFEWSLCRPRCETRHLCKNGYTQLGTPLIDPDHEKNKKGCISMEKKKGCQVKCLKAGAAQYLSGQCSVKSKVTDQCSHGSVLGITMCPGGGKFQATCDVKKGVATWKYLAPAPRRRRSSARKPLR